MKFGKTRMYKQGSHTPKRVTPTIPTEPPKAEKYVVGVDKAEGEDFSGVYTPKRKYKKKK